MENSGSFGSFVSFQLCHQQGAKVEGMELVLQCVLADS